MNEKKIIYIHTGEWPSPSPSIIFVTGTVYGLAHHTPTVLIIRNNSPEPSRDIFHSITGTDIPELLEIERVGYGGKTPGHTGFFKKAVEYVSTLAKKGDAGAVITRSIGFLPYLAYIRKRYSVPCFFETHDFYGDLAFRTDLKKKLHIRKNSLYERLSLPRLDGLICLTESQKKLFERYYPSTPGIVAPTGLFQVERKDTRREKQVCYVGSLDEHKGLGTVLSAMTHTVDKELNLLIIGGKNEHEMREFKDLATLMGVGQQVRFTGWIHHSDIAHMMDRSIAGIVPLRDTVFNRYITSPLKILDCFSRSLPVIGSDLPTVREYVEDGKHGILFTPDSPESLAETLDRFVAGGMFEKLSPEVEEHADRFLWEKRGKKIIQFINETTQS
ncbi:MAG: glycosyltransferase [Candidatus Latescibacteria bacterium]|jgi:glycosyltransferase involved in cell wall biosynthesis|nr:glycosyltransferase [Candidatus Latescibacterota bacterium]